MTEHREASEINLKEEETREMESGNDMTDKIMNCGGGEKWEDEDLRNDKYCNTLKRYVKKDLLSLRNAQTSVHYPHCAIRPELQAFSIWTCRLRCELQYLGLWKIPNNGNPYGNCSCNGMCTSYPCEGQTHPSPNPQGNPGYNQMQVQPQQPSSSPPSGSSKKSVRSRERFLSYQRCINTELIRVTSPSGVAEGSQPHHLNPVKPTFIDHRSISSSHLMPAFAKRQMGHGNVLHGQPDTGGGAHNMDHLTHEDRVSGDSNSSHFETPMKSHKDSLKNANNQNDYHFTKASTNSRLDKSDQLVESQAGWINPAAKNINSDFSSSSNNKTNSAGSVNKKPIYERRIGSGRLVPREVNWDVRTGSSGKQVEKDLSNINNNNNGEKDKDVAEPDKLNSRNSSIGRYSDPRAAQDRRIFDRRVSGSVDANTGGSSNTNKRYTGASFGEERNNIESNYHQQTAAHFTGQRSMSFRRREYVDHKNHHRDSGRENNRESRADPHHHHHNHHRDHKDEPEWFSGGPTSQHDTIELRGFEETDDPQGQASGQLSKIQSESSTTTSPVLSNTSNNTNLPTKDNYDISSEVLSNSNNTINTNDNTTDISNGSSLNSVQETPSPNIESNNANELKADVQQEEVGNSDKRRANVAEFFFDNFLNIEALEKSLIGNGNDQSMSAANDGSGTSRFSRWFFNGSNNNDESNNNPPSKEDSKQQLNNKDINESEFNSFMSFLKCNNFPTPELPKGLPSNVSALSVEELEARMRKMDQSKLEKTKCNTAGGQNIYKSDGNQAKRNECKSETNTSTQSPEINTQDVEAFRKLLDQLGKPQVDISMNIILPNTPVPPQTSTNHLGVYHPTGVSPMQPPSNALPQSNMVKQEYMMMLQQQHALHQQPNLGKMVPPLLQMHNLNNHRIPQMSPQHHNENMPLISVSHHPHPHPHPHNMPMSLAHAQKRLDVQHLIQSVVREELSRSFLENELQNPNISLYTKEIISTVLKETFYNLTLAGAQNAPDSIEAASNGDVSTAPNILIQSLARGEVSLNLVEHELNKLNNMNIVNETSASGAAFMDRSRCGTPLSSSLNLASVPTSGSVIVPLSPQVVVPAQKQNSILTGESASSDQPKHQQIISSMCRSHQQHEDSTLNLPTQRELQMHTQAIMQNALFKKKIEIEQHEALRRRQEVHKQHELEAASISQQHHQMSLNSNSQQGHQQASRHINSPTPLAFTPTSVLRKMTADKETVSSAQATTMTPSSPQQIQPHIQQPHLRVPTHSQISYQHSNHPRMILGGGNFQYIHQQHQLAPAVNINGSPQISPQQKSQIRTQPPGPLKWPLMHPSVDSNHSVLNMGNKPMGRPILKGPGPIQNLVPQPKHNPMGQNQSNPTPLSIQTVSQIQKYPSIQQPRQIVGQQFPTHIMQHQIPASQQNMQQQLFQQQQQQQQQQRSVVMQRQQIQQNELGNHASLQQPAHHPPCSDNNSVANLNFQRDGGLSPTSNQLAQWFTPELLAQASAGKLPLLNMNQALSLEEFERSIQHSSTAGSVARGCHCKEEFKWVRLAGPFYVHNLSQHNNDEDAEEFVKLKSEIRKEPTAGT